MRNEKGRSKRMVNPAEQFNNGMSFYEQGQFLEAQQAFELVLVECPTAAEAELNLGNTFFLQNQLETAEAHWLKAIEMDATVSKAYYNLGNLYFQKGDIDRAYYYWFMFSKVDPTHALVLYNLGLVCEQLKMMHKSYEFFKRFLALQPYGPEAVALQNRMKEAQPLVENNLKVAEYNLKAGNIDKALAAYEQSQLCLPMNHFAYQHFGSLLYRRARWKEAAHWYEQALIEIPRHYGILINLGIVYERLDDPLQALWSYHMAQYYGREQVSRELAKPLHRLYPLLDNESFMQQSMDRIQKGMQEYRLIETDQVAQRLNRLVLDRAPKYNTYMLPIMHQVKMFSSPQHRQIDMWEVEAAELIKQGNYEEALNLYKQCLAMGARYVDARDMQKKVEEMEVKTREAKLLALKDSAIAS